MRSGPRRAVCAALPRVRPCCRRVRVFGVAGQTPGGKGAAVMGEAASRSCGGTSDRGGKEAPCGHRGTSRSKPANTSPVAPPGGGRSADEPAHLFPTLRPSRPGVVRIRSRSTSGIRAGEGRALARHCRAPAPNARRAATGRTAAGPTLLQWEDSCSSDRVVHLVFERVRGGRLRGTAARPPRTPVALRRAGQPPARRCCSGKIHAHQIA